MKLWKSISLLIILSFALYLPTLAFQLTYLDDNVWLIDYAWYLKNLSHLPQIFIQPDLVSGIFYRPLINLSFMVNAFLNGSDPAGYRLFNLILHGANSCLVFLIFRKLKHNDRLSLLAAAVFCVHPVLAQAVVWIPGRTDSLLGFFVFLSFLSFLKYLEANKPIYLILHTLCFLLALLTKELAIILPGVCFVYLVINRKDLKSNARIFFVWILPLAVWFFLRQMALKNSQPIEMSAVFSSVLLNSSAFISYLGKIIVPFNLSVLPIVKDLSLVAGFISVFILAAGLVISKQKNKGLVVFGLVWFLFFIAPGLVLSFILHEYRLYIPIVGILIALVEMDFVKNLSTQPKKFWIVFGVVIIGLSGLSYQHSREFKDRFTFWKSAVVTSPHSPLAQRNLGAMYHLDGKLDLAKPYYEKALELNSVEFMIHNNLGLIAMDKKQYVQAEKEFLLELKINPTYDNGYFNLGILYQRLGRIDEAERVWRKTLELNPKYFNVYPHLINLYLEKNEMLSAQKYKDQLDSFR